MLGGTCWKANKICSAVQTGANEVVMDETGWVVEKVLSSNHRMEMGAGIGVVVAAEA